MKLTKEWISGFVDGDGWFSIKVNAAHPETLRHAFFVSQDEKSVDVLYALKKEFGCGTVSRAGGTMYSYVVSKEQHVRDVCIPHFTKYPLQTEKRYVFHHWASSFRKYMEKKGRPAGPPLFPAETGYKLTPPWFCGFVDAEGCFYASIVEGRPMPRFVLAARAEEKELIAQCHQLIQCGTLHTRKAGNFLTLQVFSLQQLEKQLMPFFETRGSGVLLRTKKRLAFQKFRKIVRLMVEKKHLSPEGMEKCKKYVKGLHSVNTPVPQDKVQTD